MEELPPWDDNRELPSDRAFTEYLNRVDAETVVLQSRLVPRASEWELKALRTLAMTESRRLLHRIQNMT